MLATELIEALRLNAPRKDFIAFIRQISSNTPIGNELIPITDDNGHGDFKITEHGEQMVIDLMVSLSDFAEDDVANRSKLKSLMQFNLRYYHAGKDAKNEK